MRRRLMALLSLTALSLDQVAAVEPVRRLNPYLTCPGAEEIKREMLDLINTVRGEPRQCGGERFGAAPPVDWDEQLQHAASAHSNAMAQAGFFSHTGPEGDTPWERVEAAGYAARATGENIAAGYSESNGVVETWLESPGHCANLMRPEFTEVGVACSREPDSEYGTYWTLKLAAPL